ncbi:MAG: hypothetical protein M1820_001418 [Bogoriella megaspora]|nr:MAG: hypothetical protein M1820_001418 [Bogoriella megaspora]
MLLLEETLYSTEIKTKSLHRHSPTQFQRDAIKPSNPNHTVHYLRAFSTLPTLKARRTIPNILALKVIQIRNRSLVDYQIPIWGAGIGRGGQAAQGIVPRVDGADAAEQGLRDVDAGVEGVLEVLAEAGEVDPCAEAHGGAAVVVALCFGGRESERRGGEGEEGGEEGGGLHFDWRCRCGLGEESSWVEIDRGAGRVEMES